MPVLTGLARRVARAAVLAFRARDGRLLLRTPSGRGDATMEIPTAPLTSPTLGDLLVSKGRAWVRFSPGTDGHVLTADSTATAGVKWAAGGGGSSSIDPFGRLWLVEDWIGRTTEDGEWGQLGWSSQPISSGTQTYVKVSTGTGWRDSGAIRLGGGAAGASATVLKGRVHHLGERNATNKSPLYGRPSEGTYCAVKISITSASIIKQTVWAGVWQYSNTWPDVAGAKTNSGIGVRCSETAGGTMGNWYGVVRNGTGETTVDLGVLADVNWHTLGWRATSTGIQFIVRSSGAWVDTGSEVAFTDSNMPPTTESLAPMIGCGAHGSSARTADFDLYALWCEDLERGA